MESFFAQKRFKNTVDSLTKYLIAKAAGESRFLKIMKKSCSYKRTKGRKGQPSNQLSANSHTERERGDMIQVADTNYIIKPVSFNYLTYIHETKNYGDILPSGRYFYRLEDGGYFHNPAIKRIYSKGYRE